ncbi:23S rRNA (pseudouridine(1915)-N(3))-methyltransferase RlmH [Sharpea azabuensis]|uniref:Ribosomal RNA large subunit methyltransferase H n=1 Tax=Sharpea porci TaxID=2652286 RepID=A0A844FWN4_9FIRM|nr:23S rRNA (pseudouridine(1915)-N(3))-methyltransferase RlmH [Sharpea porci]MST89792.1 23S rRNA (pseudouridine(1915)-N(3))-methyltransferase RlmH [Sharpea porci]
MKIRVIAVGKLKEKYLKEGIAEYSKRLQGYCDFELIEVADERIPQHPSLAQEALVKAKEGRRILDHVKERDYMVLLDVSSKQLDSLHFAQKLHDIMLSGYSTIDFVIGGSLGHGDEIQERANMKLSFSKMTMPHQLFRLVLVEQIYRACKINNNETYHK